MLTNRKNLPPKTKGVLHLIQNEEFQFEWTEIISLFGFASILTAIIAIFVAFN